MSLCVWFTLVSAWDVLCHSLIYWCVQYVAEAGVRQLERQLAAICRAVVVRLMDAREGGATAPRGQKEIGESDYTGHRGLAERAVHVTPALVCDLLGPPLRDRDDTPERRVVVPGIAIGLSASAIGGHVMYVETVQMPGSGRVVLTGSLGDVIKESAHLAIAWIRSHAREAGLSVAAHGNFLDDVDIHVHFPAGAVGKDGPSGGVALVTALVSLFSGRIMRTDTAMTGEITLAGTVLPVGAVKRKCLAAHAAGIRRIILPTRNFGRDLEEVSDDIRADITFLPVDTVPEALSYAFWDGLKFISAQSKL